MRVSGIIREPLNERRETNTNQSCHNSGILRTTKPSGGYARNTELKTDLRKIEEHQPEGVQPNG